MNGHSQCAWIRCLNLVMRMIKGLWIEACTLDIRSFYNMKWTKEDIIYFNQSYTNHIYRLMLFSLIFYKEITYRYKLIKCVRKPQSSMIDFDITVNQLKWCLETLLCLLLLNVKIRNPI